MNSQPSCSTMKTIICFGVISFLASLAFAAVLIGRSALHDNFDGTDLIYPMAGLTASWIIFLSCASFAMIRRARKKVSLWPIEKRMHFLTTAKMTLVIYDIIDRGLLSVRELQNDPKFLALFHEYLAYKKSGGKDDALPEELLNLFREVATDISAAGKEK